MKKILSLLSLSVLSCCSYHINVIHTEGIAADVADADFNAQDQFSPNFNQHNSLKDKK